MNCRKYIACLICIYFVFVPVASTAKNLPPLTESMAVMIEIPNGNQSFYGSGTYLAIDKCVYLITAKHVLFSGNSNNLLGSNAILFSYDSYHNKRARTDVNLQVLKNNKNIIISPTQDIVAIKLTDNDQYIAGVIRHQDGASTIVYGYSLIRYYKEVYVSDDIYIIGFPRSIGVKESPQIDYDIPLFRKGIVAGKNEKNRTIIIDSPAYGGNSGGPVLELTEGGHRLIGIVTEYVPIRQPIWNGGQKIEGETFGNSAYAVVVPMDTILDLIYVKK